MTMAAAVRAVLLMTLMAEAGDGEVLQALFGDLALLPWHVPFARADGHGARHVAGRGRPGAAAAAAGHGRWPCRTPSTRSTATAPSRSVTCGSGSIDGSVTRMADTPANRGGVRVGRDG